MVTRSGSRRGLMPAPAPGAAAASATMAVAAATGAARRRMTAPEGARRRIAPPIGDRGLALEFGPRPLTGSRYRAPARCYEIDARRKASMAVVEVPEVKIE